MMETVYRAVAGFFDVLYRPFGGQHAFWALVAMSAVTGVVMLFLFKYTTRQERMRVVKDRIKMHFIELRLYQDDMRVLWRTQGRILRANLEYVKLVVIAALIIVIPVVFILMDMDMRFGRRPLEVGETALVKVALAGRGGLPEVDLVPPAGVMIETPKVRIPTEREVDWRLHASEAGVFDLAFRVDGREFVKKLSAGSSFAYLGKDPDLKGSPIQSIEVAYPERRFGFDSWMGHWLTLFCVFSVVVGFALKPVFDVE
jgi:hypothetical protein